MLAADRKNQIRAGRQRLSQFYRRRTDRLKGPGIIGDARLKRACPSNPAQPPDLRRCIGIAFDPAQRAMLRQNPAPAQQSENMSRRTGQIFQPE